MHIYEAQNRASGLISQLVAVWETSVRETHLFLTDAEIARIEGYVPQALGDVPHLVVAEQVPGQPVAFMGIAGERLEMLFLAPAVREKGLGRELLMRDIRSCGVRKVTVNEQNSQAVGFYVYMGFTTYKRTDHDEAGDPYPLLYMRLPGGARRLPRRNKIRRFSCVP